MNTIYVTRYALTEGPRLVVRADVRADCKSATWRDAGGNRWFVYGKDFWLTEAEALADCERRRAAKLASIEKQRKKLEAMQFTIN